MNIKSKIRKQYKKEKKKLWILILVVLPLILLGKFGIFSSVKNDDYKTENRIKHSNEKFLKYIMFGDTWIEDEKWNPAIEMYKKALKLAPTNYDARYRLLLAYSYKCEKMKFDCDIGQALSDSLLNEYPNKQMELFVLDSIFKKNKTEPILLNK